MKVINCFHFVREGCLVFSLPASPLMVYRKMGENDRDFTKSLIIRDFDDVLKNIFRYVDLFLSHTLLSKKIPKIAMHD